MKNDCLLASFFSWNRAGFCFGVMTWLSLDFPSNLLSVLFCFVVVRSNCGLKSLIRRLQAVLGVNSWICHEYGCSWFRKNYGVFSEIGFKAPFEYCSDRVSFVIIRGCFGCFWNRARKYVLLRTWWIVPSIGEWKSGE